MSERISKVTYGDYVLEESNIPNRLEFYRIDGKKILGITSDVTFLYQRYISFKILNGELNSRPVKNIKTVYNEDKTKIILFVYDPKEKQPDIDTTIEDTKQLIKSIFKKR